MTSEAWTPAFPGQRPPFEPGNQAALRHGGYSVLRLADRARSIADHLRDQLPAASSSDETTLELLSVTLARVEAGERALAQLDERTEDNPLSVYLSENRDKLERLRQDLAAGCGRRTVSR